jgi:tetratricopeptide (TPR) repeat protein
MASDQERKAFYEAAKQQAQDEVERNPNDAHALTRWGGALLELANFMPGEEAAHYVDEAVDKFQHALRVDAKKHEALWCLGNAYTSQGFLSTRKSDANVLFKKAQVRALETSVPAVHMHARHIADVLTCSARRSIEGLAAQTELVGLRLVKLGFL